MRSPEAPRGTRVLESQRTPSAVPPGPPRLTRPLPLPLPPPAIGPAPLTQKEPLVPPIGCQARLSAGGRPTARTQYSLGSAGVSRDSCLATLSLLQETRPPTAPLYRPLWPPGPNPLGFRPFPPLVPGRGSISRPGFHGRRAEAVPRPVAGRVGAARRP